MDLQAFIAVALALQGADAPRPTPALARAAFTCPSGMKAVWGTHEEQLQRLCIDWRGQQCWRWFGDARAGEGRRTPVATCMDELEWPNQRGSEPMVMVRYVEAEAACKQAGKRLCTEFEWETACEGPEALGFPYGNDHDPHACNNDKVYRSYSAKALESKDAQVRDKEVKRLYQGEPTGSRLRCTSAFGVMDLVGNAEEWVMTSRPEWPFPSSLKGGYWSKPWSGCRGTNDSHGPLFRFYETGFRCCANPAPTAR